MTNSLPQNFKRIHFIAVCGVGMASLAGLLKEKGLVITGSDQNVYPPMSDLLKNQGIPLFNGYRPENIQKASPDLVVVGNAVSKDNPEVIEAKARGIPLFSMPQSIADHLLPERTSLVVAGTHGKTTTSALLAWLLDAAGEAPGFLVGGILKNFGRSYQLGRPPYFVLEGDEYDSAFFDKGPKFLHYRPQGLILNAVEYDHADIYRDLDHVLEAFGKLIALLPSDGLVLADGSDPNARQLAKKAACRVLLFSPDENADFTASDVRWGEKVRFRLLKNGRSLGDFESPLCGRHNLKNTLAVLGLLTELGVPVSKLENGLRNFQGVKRRQEVLTTIRGITIIDDFAHHPTAVAETLAGLRLKYPKARVWAVFEPRSNTTRRKVFQKSFVEAFRRADETVIAPPFQPEKIPEDNRLDPDQLAADLQQAGIKARFLDSIDTIVTTVSAESKSGDVVCFMSNGGFGGIHEKMIQKLKK